MFYIRFMAGNINMLLLTQWHSVTLSDTTITFTSTLCCYSALSKLLLASASTFVFVLKKKKPPAQLTQQTIDFFCECPNYCRSAIFEEDSPSTGSSDAAVVRWQRCLWVREGGTSCCCVAAARLQARPSRPPRSGRPPTRAQRTGMCPEPGPAALNHPDSDILSPSPSERPL